MKCEQRLTITERVEQVVREWPNWSRAELRNLDAIVDEVLDHCRTGTGNGFIRKFVNRVVVPRVPDMVATN